MMDVFSEDFPQRQRLGSALRDLRTASDLSQEALAKLLDVGQSTISRLEKGEWGKRRPPDPRLIERWGTATDATAEQVDELLRLLDAPSAQVTSWRRHLQGKSLADLQRETAEMEERAGKICVYQPVILPGLTQLPEVVRHVHRARNVGLPGVEEGVTANLARLSILYDETTTLQFVFGEVALRWRTLPPELIARQAAHLARISRLPNVTIGIIPVDADLPVWHTHGFVLFDDLDGEPELGQVHLELRSHAGNIGDPEDVEDYRRVFAALLDTSVKGDAARELLDRVAEDIRRSATYPRRSIHTNDQ